MNELKPEDVMKALECCSGEEKHCEKCPYNHKATDTLCIIDMIRDALAILREWDGDYKVLEELYQEKCDQVLKVNELWAEKSKDFADYQEDVQMEIAEKDAEIERLTKICRSYALQYGTAMDQSKVVAEIRAEIISEYIERAKKRLPVISPSVFEQIAKDLESWLRR